MKSTGIIRRLDDLGRITIPIELRRSLGIIDRDSIEIIADDDQIILKKYNSEDIFTGETEDLIDYHGKLVSRKSIIEMAKIAGIIPK
ncbi:MAG: AbrB/MazE/SpoVT family DNA-binding domain-containing protein [Lachnospiraceae bacterium]|nr:AbrB/MazE/SpoVT family DNA-binding domain-containing protein [Lachnospiraceae bacterium]